MLKGQEIKNIKAREILDSRGIPTVEVGLTTSLGTFFASAPSGASKGKYESLELRDGGKRYRGKGVLKAVGYINKIIAPKLKGRDVTKQKEIDKFLIGLDGTKNKSRLGANAILPVSMVVCRAGARAKNLPLFFYIYQITGGTTPKDLKEIFPKPCFNVINGGVHAGSELDFQEFIVVGQEKVFSKNLEMVSEIYQELKIIIKEKYIDLSINVGDEGGFVPSVRVPEEAIGLVLEAAKNLGYLNKIKIILDVAANQFFKNNQYKTKFGIFNRKDLLNYYLNLIKNYPILGLEDPFSEDDFDAWRLLTENCKLKIRNFLVIGDDLLATNLKRIKMAEKRKLCNAVIIKLNQIGTISEAIEAAKLAKIYGWKIVVSHRSGETCDDFIADFGVGIGADFVKFGAPARGERVAKYNRLLEIESEL